MCWLGDQSRGPVVHVPISNLPVRSVAENVIVIVVRVSFCLIFG